MTTAVRPLPPHGTPSRGRGSQAAGRPSCPCPPCRKAARTYNKQMRYLASTGRSRLVDAAPARDHLRTLIDNGDAISVIAEQLGRPRSTIASLANNPRTRITRVLADQILAIRPGKASACNRSVASVGTTRRMRALVALGHPVRVIAETAGIEYSTASYLLNGHPNTVHYELTQRVASAYRRLSGTAGSHVRSLRRAQREAWAPPAAWDDETLDDPNAEADWTGCCGTDRGWWTHMLEKLPVCKRCETAHQQWKADRRSLPRSEYMSALGTARAAAANRGSNIAADARELMRVSGLDHEQVAARLGVTRQHLYQELGRHPELAEEAA